MDNSISFKKSLICTSILLALGTNAGLTSATEYGAKNSNFTMLSPSGGAVGGTNLVKVTWDGTLNDDVNTAVVNMTISSPAPFFGEPWSAHDVKVFGPGTYVFEACPLPISAQKKAADGSLCTSGVSTPVTLTVGAGQIGAHMLFDWNISVNIDVINVWDVDAVWGFGINDATDTSLIEVADTDCTELDTAIPVTPECDALLQTQWMFVTTDPDADGFPGSGMVDGPFKTYNAAFNIRQQAIFDDALTAIQNTSATTVALIANDQLPTTSGAGIFTITAFDATSAQGGAVVDNGDGTLSYLPPLNYQGPDSFTYTVNDGVDHSTDVIGLDGNYEATAMVIVDVILDPIPTLTDDSASTNMDEAVTTADVFSNDVFPANGEVFTITAFDATSVNGGSVVNNLDNTFTYTPAAGYIGMDSFSYTVDDGKAHLASALVNIDVLDPFPVPVNDSVETAVNKAVTTTDVMANDVLPINTEVFTIIAFDATSVEGGSVVNNGDNTFTYTPANGFKGTDSFTYTIDDGKAHAASATVNVEVKAGKSSSTGSVFALPLMLLLLPLRLLTRKQ